MPEQVAGKQSDATCPRCGHPRLYGPATIVDPEGSYRYYDCPRCHSLVLEDPATGDLVARAGAW